MTNVNTRYWKRVIAYFDRVEKGEGRPDYDELLKRAKAVARHGQAANDLVGELEVEVERLRRNLRAVFDAFMQALEHVPGDWDDECKEIASRIRADIYGKEATAGDQ